MIDVNPLQLQRIRKGLGLSLAPMGLRLGVTAAAVCKYEQGKTIPSYGVLLQYSKLAGEPFIICHNAPHPLHINKQTK